MRAQENTAQHGTPTRHGQSRRAPIQNLAHPELLTSHEWNKLAQQDDVGSPCLDVSMARVHATLLATLMQEKTLLAHPDKTGYLILGSTKFRNTVKKEISECPISFGKFDLKEKTKDKYLGQVFESNLSTSALSTVQERAGKIKGAAIEIKSIIEDFQMQALSGCMAAWELWEHALLPSLLSGAGTWLGDVSKTVDLCDSIQNFFWRLILELPESCPKVALRSETRMIGMKWRVWEAKCLQLKQIQKLEDTALAKKVCGVAEDRGWPGLQQEVKEICAQIGIPDMNKSDIPKWQIKEAIFYSHYTSMKNEMESSTKLEDIKNDDFRKIQPYFLEKSVANTRLAFRIRTKMVKKIPGNFKNMYKNNPEGLKCSHCMENIMTQNHCLACPGLAEHREGLELKNIEDMVVFFRRILMDKDKT